MIRRFLSLTIFCAALPASAGQIFEYPASDLAQAVALIQEFLESKSPQQTRIRRALRELDPSGPVFIDKVLALLADDPTPWKSFPEPRAVVLTMIFYVAGNFEPTEDFEGSALKESIHFNAQRVLSKFPISSQRQREVVEIFNRLDLWDESDLPFLAQKFFNRPRRNPKISNLLRLFESGAPEFKENFANRVRKAQKKEILEYAVLYRFGLLRDKEIIWMFRLSMSDLVAGVARENGDARPLLDWVLFDLHRRLRQGDPAVVAAYDKVRASPSWSSSLSWTPEKRSAIDQFLRDLWTGRNFVKCETHLALVPSNDI